MPTSCFKLEAWDKLSSWSPGGLRGARENEEAQNASRLGNWLVALCSRIGRYESQLRRQRRTRVVA